MHTLILVGLAVLADAAAIHPRGTIASDQIVGFPVTVPSGTNGAVYTAYQPHLYVANGCVPFPGVDASGNTKSVPFLVDMPRRTQHDADMTLLSVLD